MKINIKNLTNTNKRIILRPREEAEISANIGVDNPTLNIDENKVLSVCLAPSRPKPDACEGAINEITLGTLSNGGSYDFYINDVLLEGTNKLYKNSDMSFKNILLNQYNVHTISLNTDLEEEDYTSGNASVARFINNSNDNVRIKIICVDANPLDTEYELFNPSVVFIDNQAPNYVNGASFCLAPNNKPIISCEGAINTAITGGIWLAPVMYVNGVFYNYIDSVLDLVDVDRDSELKWNWTNLTTENMRIRIEAKKEGLHSNDEGWQINPNPTLDVNFETGIIEFCLAPKNDCEPIGAEILGQGRSLEAQTYFVDYKLNGGDIKTVTFVAPSSTSTFDVATYLFGEIYNENGWKLFELHGSNQPTGLDDQTHPCPFRSYHFRDQIISAETINSSDDDYVNEPTTLEFILNPNKQGIDAVELYFGQTTVIHACSYKTWDGL